MVIKFNFQFDVRFWMDIYGHVMIRNKDERETGQ